HRPDNPSRGGLTHRAARKTEGRAVLVDAITESVTRLMVGMLAQIAELDREFFRHPYVVGVEKCDERSRGPRDPEIPEAGRIGAVLDGDRVNPQVREGPEVRWCAIGRAVVDDDQLPVLVRL